MKHLTRQQLLEKLSQLEQQIVRLSDRKYYLKTLLNIRTKRYPFKRPAIRQAA